MKKTIIPSEMSGPISINNSSMQMERETSLIDAAEVNAKLDLLAKTFMNQLGDKTGFKTIIQYPECILQEKEDNSGSILKWQFKVPFEPLEFFRFTADTSARSKWDPNVRAISTLYDDGKLRVTHTMLRKILVVSSRDFLLASKIVQIGMIS